MQATLLVRLRPAARRTTSGTASAGGRRPCSTGEPRVEDGPGWWAARAAIEAAASAGAGAAQRWLRTAYVVADDAAGAPDPGLVNAGLVLRDERVAGLSERSVSVLRGLLSTRDPARVAEALGISASAVSQRVRADGLAAIVAADDLLVPADPGTASGGGER